MVEYFSLNNLCRRLYNPVRGDRMNCFIEDCHARGTCKCTIRVMEKDIMLCERHNRIYGNGDIGRGPIMQNI